MSLWVLLRLRCIELGFDSLGPFFDELEERFSVDELDSHLHVYVTMKLTPSIVKLYETTVYSTMTFVPREWRDGLFGGGPPTDGPANRATRRKRRNK